MTIKILPSQSRLKELFHLDPETGIFIRRVSTSNRVKVGDVAGNHSPDGYRYIHVDSVRYKAHRLAYVIYHGEFLSSMHIDHVNGKTDDNRKSNLRLATVKQNLENTGKPKNNTSGFKGVSFNKPTKKWMAYIKNHGKRIYLGLYLTPDLAFAAYCEAADKFFTHHQRKVL